MFLVFNKKQRKDYTSAKSKRKCIICESVYQLNIYNWRWYHIFVKDVISIMH